MRTLALAILALILPGAAIAQPCTPTLRGYQSGPIDFNASQPAFVGAMTLYDDGNGPALVAAGFFGMPPLGGNSSGTSVARCRNGVWSSMHTGLPFTSGSAMRVLVQADLSANGGPGPSLYTAGDSGQIYRWTGTQWTSASFAVPGPCYTMLAYADAQGPVLLAAGNSGGVFAWRGTGPWTQYAPLTVSNSVYKLRVVDDGSGPALFAVGSLRDNFGILCIAKLVGGQWTPYTVNVPNVQYFSDFTSFDNGVDGPELYIAGGFSTQTTPNAGVARLHNGTWDVVGTRLNVDGQVLGPTFFKIDEGQGERLYVGGGFQQPGVNSGLVRLVTTPAPGWQAPVFLFRAPASSPASGTVHAMARYDDGGDVKTYFGGAITAFRTDPATNAPTTQAYGLIRSTDPLSTAFESTARGLGDLPFSPPTQIRYSLSVVDIGQGPRLFAAAPFGRAGGRMAPGAVLYDGAGWTPLWFPPGGPGAQAIQFGVVASIGGQQRLVSYLSSSPLGPIAYWDGAQWARLPVQPPVSTVYALAVLNGTLYVLSDPGLYRYTGAAWVQDIPGSANQCSMITGDIGRGQRLYVTISGPMGPGLYEYDGAIYSRLGPTFGLTPNNLAIHDDGGGPALYVAGSGVPFQVARFQNNTFVAIAPGFSLTGPTPLAMASFHDGVSPALYIAGGLNNAGGVQTNGFVRWHAGAITNVVPFAPGLSPQGLPRASLAVLGNRLYLAGEFYNIGNVVADHLAYIDACPRTCTADFNYDGDAATDADIEAFFACLAGSCCPNCASADFNGDGDVGNDADIESFFRVLAGGPC